ncbi:hypothetical protein [Endozoicomonas sp. ALE010]|uniref:hypothetical protein n=1 Tax=Endozoicomonas sp. ALE010 TaxID=3403081 RepID=UPI003BB645C9
MIKTIVDGIKAKFGRYTVSILGGVTLRLVLKKTNSSYAKMLRKPLNAYQIDIAKTFSDKEDSGKLINCRHLSYG